MPKPLTVADISTHAPARDEFYAWMLEQLDLPDGTPLTRGCFESTRILESRWEWSWKYGNAFFDGKQKVLDRLWGQKLFESLQMREAAPSLLRLWREHPISAAGWVTLRRKTRFPTHREFTNAEIRRTKYGENYISGLPYVELLLRYDIEVLGRARVAQRGPEFYLEILNQTPDFSAHQTLETAMMWRDLKLFEPRDAEFCARFPPILAAHKVWLADRRLGQRAVLCGRDLREVSWPKGALRGADLRGAILRDLDLSGDDLRNCDLRWADLTAANLFDCRLEWANLRESWLDLALVRNVGPFWALGDSHQWLGVVDDGTGVWNDPNYKHALRRDYCGCDLRARNFTNIRKASDFDFSGCDLRGADLSRVNFSESYRGTCFDDADLRGANVWGANFCKCSFEGAKLDGILNADFAQWDDAPPRNRDFRGAQWKKAILYNRNFASCDFSGADLRGASLDRADFSNANLRDADLRGATVHGTNLRDADLTGARVGKKALKRAIFK